MSGPTSPAPVRPDVAADRTEVTWSRLDVRVVWANAVKFVVSLIPTALGLWIFGVQQDSLGLWPALIATSIGILSSCNDVRRWWLTRYRVTADRVEIKVGRLVTRHRSVPLDRIRTVNTTSKLRHRLAGLRVVMVSAGEDKHSIRLDALRTSAADELRTNLSGRTRSSDRALLTTTAAAVDAAPEAEVHRGPAPEVLARYRWWWVFYNIVSIWGFLVGILLLWSAYWSLRLIRVDLLDVWDDLIGWRSLNFWHGVALTAPVVFVIGCAAMAVLFVTSNWKFALTRERTENGTSLVSRFGLLRTNEVHRDESRVRGIHIGQPLLWQWMGLCETRVISTGLTGWSPGAEEASIILPRAPISEARRVARLVLPDEHPLETPLDRHGRGALTRRLVWAVVVPMVAVGAMAAFTASGAIDGVAWGWALWSIPVTCVLAWIGYRALGHRIVGQYLVYRLGVSRRMTTVLQARAVIGWQLRQTLLQRVLGLMSVITHTAAGEKRYELPDVDLRAAARLMSGATPEMVENLLQADRRSPVVLRDEPARKLATR